MDFSKVKLVVTDMDGTLLNSKSEVSDRFFKVFNQLKKKNIHFIAASGRQHESIVDRLAAIKYDITIVAENGGFAKQGDTELFSTTLPISGDFRGTFARKLQPVRSFPLNRLLKPSSGFQSSACNADIHERLRTA